MRPRGLCRDGEIADMFSSLTESELDYLREAAEEFISPGAINSIGTLGTSNRTYPTDYQTPHCVGNLSQQTLRRAEA